MLLDAGVEKFSLREESGGYGPMAPTSIWKVLAHRCLLNHYYLFATGLLPQTRCQENLLSKVYQSGLQS